MRLLNESAQVRSLSADGTHATASLEMILTATCVSKPEV